MIYNLGLCDENEKAQIQQYCDQTVAFIKDGLMLEAFNVWDKFLNGDVWPYGNYFHNITGLNDYVTPCQRLNPCGRRLRSKPP